MTDSRRPFGAEEPLDIDDTEDRMGSVEPLDFDDPVDTHESLDYLVTDEEYTRHVGEHRPRNREISGAALPGRDSSPDDLDADMLIPEDGARDAYEALEEEGGAADWDLSVVNEDEIGAGRGLDEAELADIDPVGRKE